METLLQPPEALLIIKRLQRRHRSNTLLPVLVQSKENKIVKKGLQGVREKKKNPNKAQSPFYSVNEKYIKEKIGER